MGHLGRARCSRVGIWVRTSREEAARMGPTRGSQCCEEPAEWFSRRYPRVANWVWTQTHPNHPGPSGTEPSTLPTSWFPRSCLAVDMPKIWPHGFCLAAQGSHRPQGGCWTGQGGAAPAILEQDVILEQGVTTEVLEGTYKSFWPG